MIFSDSQKKVLLIIPIQNAKVKKLPFKSKNAWIIIDKTQVTAILHLPVKGIARNSIKKMISYISNNRKIR